nr:response regulator transcription factor [uncultured Carboxylicivirga sp.]
MKYRIAIVDDHPLFREGFKSIINLTTENNKLLMFSDGEEILNYLEKDADFDVVFMDILMPLMDGITATIKIKDQYPGIKILGFSSLESIEYVEKMIKAGVDGYVLKEASPNVIFKAIDAVMKGNNYFSSKVIIKLSRRAMDNQMVDNDDKEAHNLSARELQILKLLCAGIPRKDIGNRLFISERTVDKHKENILKKTNSKNVMQLIFFSLKNSLIDTNLLDQVAS